MKFFKELFMIQVKRVLRIPYLICLLILPLILLIAAHYIGQDKKDNIHIGIYYEEGLRKDEIVKWVIQNSDFRFQVYQNQDAMLEDVARKKIQAGYILLPEIEEGIWKNSIQTYANEDYVSGNMLGEILIAGVIRSLSGDLGAEALSSYFPNTQAEMSENILEHTYQYTADGSLIQTNIHVEKSAENNISETEFDSSLILHAILSMGIMLLILFQNQQLIKGQQKGVLSLLNASASRRYFISYLVIGACFAFLCALVSLSTLALSLNNGRFVSGKEILLILDLIVMVETFSLYLTRILHTSTQYFFSILFLFFVSILFGIRIFPMKNIVPVFWVLQYISPIYYYQAGISGAMKFRWAFGILFSSAILFVVLSTIKKKRSK